MGTKKVPLIKEQFDQIISSNDWKIDDVPQKNWSKIPGIVRPEDTFAIMASGTISDQKIINNIHAIAGFDVLVHEQNPMDKKGEPAGNAYHYVIQKITHEKYQYIMHGPFKSETRVNHWFDADDLDAYWDDNLS